MKNAVLAYLRLLGGFWEKRWGGQYVRSGMPDIIGCYRGMYVAIELKAPGRYANLQSGLTVAQRHTINMLALAGAYVLVADTLEEVQRFMKTLGGFA